MKKMAGWKCARCSAVTLECAGARAGHCRGCGSAEFSERISVFQVSRADIASDDAARRSAYTFRRCPDCGEEGESRGHQTCQYPSNVGDGS